MKDKPDESKQTETGRWRALKAVLSGRKEEARSQDETQQPEPPPVVETTEPSTIDPRLILRARDDQARLAALYRVLRMLGTSLDLDEVLIQVMDAVIGLTGAERGILVYTEADPSNWTLRVARNFDEEKLSNWDAEISRTIIDTAIQTKQGIVTADAMSDPRFSMQASVIFNVLRSTLCTPLLARGRVIGAIYVDSRIQKGIFDEKDLEMLDAFAVQAAFAIDNARIYTRTVREVQQLKIELDEVRKAHQVAEITESEYFRQLLAKVKAMRKPSGGGK